MQSTARYTTDSKILIRGARQVVTLQGPARMRVGQELERLEVLRDTSLLIENGRILQIGSARRLEHLREAASARWVDARRMVVLPGFVDVAGDLTGAGGGVGDSGNFIPVPASGASHLMSRRLTMALDRMALAGSTFARISFPFPMDAAQRSHLLRSLVTVDLPLGCFQAALRTEPSHLAEEAPETLALRDLVPPSALAHWRELAPALAMEITRSGLRSIEPASRFRMLRVAARDMPCQLTENQLGGTAAEADGAWTATELLDLGLVASCLVEGSLPREDQQLYRLAQWAFPWLLCAGPAALRVDPALNRLPRAIAAGLRIALATGYRPGIPGVFSPLALTAMLRQQTGASPSQLLQMQIANTAHALGVGHRMGSIEAGKEANLLLLDCEDYREIGLYVGVPRVVAVFRRGKVLGADETGLFG